MKVDVNTDTGESFGRWRLGNDDALLAYVSSANIACGMHAGDPSVMDSTVASCVEKGVATGAHPGFSDLQGFGRREIRMAPGEIESLVMYQVGALKVFAESRGASLTHVKVHGSLYNMASVDERIAMAVARGVARSTEKGEHLILVGLPGSSQLWAAKKLGIPAAAEGFCDRAYYSDGKLVPRSAPGSVITDVGAIAARAVDMVRNGRVDTLGGGQLDLAVETICIHGDTPGALEIAKAVRASLEAAGIEVVNLHRVLGL